MLLKSVYRIREMEKCVLEFRTIFITTVVPILSLNQPVSLCCCLDFTYVNSLVVINLRPMKLRLKWPSTKQNKKKNRTNEARVLAVI